MGRRYVFRTFWTGNKSPVWLIRTFLPVLIVVVVVVMAVFMMISVMMITMMALMPKVFEDVF
jgi:hypothetical protein